MPDDDKVIVARGLAKRYAPDAPFAVDAIDLDIAAGTCFGMLGPNGAGKSSTMRMIACVSPPTAGELHVLGRDVRRDQRAIKARLGVVPQDDNLDDDLTVRENLVVYAGYFGIPGRTARTRADELLEFMELGSRGTAKVKELSGGMRRRLVIARALVNEPELVLLDEPTTGLDPQARQQIWARLRRLRDTGTTLVLTTHYMEEASQLCDDLVIMHKAEILRRGHPRDLIRDEVARNVIEFPRYALDPDTDLAPLGPVPSAVDRAAGAAPATALARSVDVLDDRVLIGADDTSAVLAALAAGGIDTTLAIVRMATLEDVFLELTGREDTEVSE